MRIGWIGLGKLGLPMAKRIREAGNTVVVYARNAAGCERAAHHGFDSVKAISALCRDVEIVISSIYDDDSLYDIIASTGGLAQSLSADQIFIDTSTVSPLASSEVAKTLSERSVPYLRLPVSGSVATAERGELTAIGSGPQAAFDRVRPLISSFASRIFYLGPEEEARYMKLSLNAMVGAMAPLLGEALKLSVEGGVTLATALEVFSHSAVSTPLLNYKRSMILADNYEPAFSLAGMLKDLDIIALAAREQKNSAPILAAIREQYAKAVDGGDGEKDFS